MRTAFLAAVSLFLTGAIYTPGVGPGPLYGDQGGGWKTVWYQPLDKNGVSSATSLPSGFTTPAIIWVGWSPLVNYGSAGGTFTASGAPTVAYSPFCYSGTFSDLTSSTNCLQGKGFTGAEYYEFSGTAGDINSTHISACVIFEPHSTAAGLQDIIGKRGDVGDDGWSLRYQGSANGGSLYIETNAANITRNTAAGIHLGSWSILCGTAAAGGNTYAYNNGTASGATAYPAGVATTTTAFRVGTSSAGATLFDGNILAAYVWPGTTLTAANIKQFVQFWEGMLATNEYAADQSTTGGNTCYWYGGKIMCFADDFMPIGAGIAPGFTGAGTTGGFLGLGAYTNVLLNSRDVSASWVETGTVIGATSTLNSPFWESAVFPVTLLEDNDAAGAEYLTQTVDMTALTTGVEVLFVVYARSGSGTAGLDARIGESGGAGCTAASTDYTALALTTTWTEYQFAYTITDGDCTTMTVDVGPVSAAGAHDFLTVGETGTMYGLFMLIYYLDSAPPMYIETGSGATAAGGNMIFKWLNNSSIASLIQDTESTERKVDITILPYTTNPVMTPSGTGIMWLIDDGTATVYYRCRMQATSLTCADVDASITMSINPITYTVGTPFVVTTTWGWKNDYFAIYKDYVYVTSTTSAESPPAAVDTLNIFAATSGNSAGQGFGLKGLTIKKK